MGLVQDLILPTRRPPVWPYLIEHSALFDGVDDCLSRTPVSAGDRRTWTFSLWPKLCRTANQTVFAASTVGYYRFEVRHINGAISVGQEEGNNNAPLSKVLDGVVDYTGLYHIVVSVDTANAVAEDRVKVYINGTRRTQFSTNQNIPQNHDTFVNATVGHYFGCGFLPAVGGRYLFTQMYASEFHFIDGQALTPDAFGEWSDKVTGLWTPKAYTGTYGTNGCKLDFSNAAALGDDVSGNGNNWTVNGSPVQTVDTPTNNYCTLNALDKSSGTLLTRGNLMAEYPTGAHHACRGTRSLPTVGKWYWECERLAGKTFIAGIGTGRASLVNYVGAEVHSYGYSGQDGLFYHPGFTTSSGVTLAEGDILGVAYDADDATLVFYKNGVKITGGFSAIPEDAWMPLVSNYSASSAFPGGTTVNFGATGFAHTPPAGFLPLCVANLPEPTILRSGTVADIVLREGTGAEASVTGLEFTPDWADIKARNTAYAWVVYDAVRGAGKEIYTHSAQVESDNPTGMQSFDVGGYTLSTGVNTNAAGVNFLDLCLKAGVSQGFEIVTYTGNGVANRTIGHALGKAPTFMMVKRLTNGGGNWLVYHAALGDGKYLILNGAGAGGTGSYVDQPTSTTFRVGDQGDVNALGESYVAYVFADSDIFKAFSYTGNGLADGPFVNLGGRPLAIPFWKGCGTTNWFNFDAMRNPRNPITHHLLPSASNVEGTDTYAHFTSAGMKVQTALGGVNTASQTYVGLAILQSTKHSNAF